MISMVYRHLNSPPPCTHTHTHTYTLALLHTITANQRYLIVSIVPSLPRFRSVNCTVGPGSSEWYAVEKEYTPRLRDLVTHGYGVDILGKEGSWFISPQFLALHNIPFLHGMVSISLLVSSP
jgi:hypothetical protein